MKDIKKYKDIIYKPYIKSNKYPHMSTKKRAMQFSSFAALDGFKECTNNAEIISDNKRGEIGDLC